MKISKKSRYGLRAMIELALHKDEGPIPARVISKKQDIPLQYLEQIFNKLKKEGLVNTSRGPNGGYLISREPSKIKIKSIIMALEGEDFLLDCLSSKKPSCKRSDNCRARRFWKKLGKGISDILDSTTLQDLCKGPKAKEEAGIGHRYLFQI
ncbi:MAG: Rrf2 family transcriptional regulator [Candidatus Omnitrophota bacterium]